MALPTVNLSLNAIHIEVGGSTGTTVSLNDADVRGMGNPDSTYAGGDGINTTDQSTISMGEFRNGQNYISPAGTWITANSSQLAGNEWSFYVDNTVNNSESGTALSQVGVNLIAKETSTHLEIWADAGPNVDNAEARLADDTTIVDPGLNAYKIWSYALPSGVSGFTAHYTDLSYWIVDVGSLSVPLLSTSVSGYSLLEDGTAGSLSSDGAVYFYTTATSTGAEGYVYQAWRNKLAFEFNRTGYKITPEFTVYYYAIARSHSCFDANTLVQMADGSVKAISSIQLGDITKGGEVFGIHTFLGGPNAYDYNGVILSGTHWVVENGKVMDVQDTVLARKVRYIPKYWYSLTTEDNRIWANDVEFYDEGCMDFTSLNKYAQALINGDKEEIKKWGDKSTELSGGLEQRYLGINK